MRIKTLVAGLLVCSGLLRAQDDPYVTKVVRVHGDAAKLNDLACPGSGLNCEASAPLRAIVLKGHAHMVTQVEQTIQELDAISPSPNSNPGKNVELTVYVLGGSTQPFVGAQDVTGESLSPVVKQLRAIFPYSHYQLLSTLVMRSALGQTAESFGMMGVALRPTPDLHVPTRYQIKFNSAKVSDAGSNLIHLARFEFSVRVPYVSGSIRVPVPGEAPQMPTQFSETNAGLQTDLDLREGQKVVVGKTNVSDSDSCFFLVLSAKLVP
ncbi:MAG TPA: hypothetical protein VHZ55_16490 [Bryobacteraceae bacterium]|jgi:hypothetical protein|nr:hypothetical protein [Bryobacteraceae bacterium]